MNKLSNPHLYPHDGNDSIIQCPLYTKGGMNGC